MPSNLNLSLNNTGRLQVKTSLVALGQPLSNVLVRVSERGDASSIIEELYTDSSGLTPTIDLPTPPIDYSLDPNMPQPFSEYDVDVIMDEAPIRIVEGVQIFPNNTSFQNLILQPSEQTTTTIVTVPPPTLWGNFPPKIPEDPVKELPPSTGFVVLPDPVVPEFIIVHDGVPSNRSAPNYWVPFKDYIKNVASSEIYPTWPEATITANVLAIISFTLNRVYTEWYRGKGYDFTVTSSTAYDQAYQRGRDVFESIGKVVDNIFTTFITKPGIRQPLLTQYCDGKQVSCPNWMTS